MRSGVAAAIGLLMLIVPVQVQALDECATRGDNFGWYVPDHARVQTGGLLGFLTVGVGYSAFDALNFDLYYGWVPAAIGGTEIQTLAARVSAHLEPVCLGADVSWTYLVGGVGALMGFGEGFFLSTPDEYSDGYYAQTAVRGILSVGNRIAIHQSEDSPFARHVAFVEVTALDEYLLVWLKNPSQVAPWEVWSLSFGYEAGF